MCILELQRNILQKLRLLRGVDSRDESDGSDNGELGDIGRAGGGGCDLRVGHTLVFRSPKGGDGRKTAASSASPESLSQAQEVSIAVGPSGWLVADASVSAQVCRGQHQAQTHGEPLVPAPHQAASTAPPSTAEPRESLVTHHQPQPPQPLMQTAAQATAAPARSECSEAVPPVKTAPSDCTEPSSGAPGACSSGSSSGDDSVEPPATAGAFDGSVGHHNKAFDGSVGRHNVRHDVTHDPADETLHALEPRARRDSSGSYSQELGHAMGRPVLAAEADGVTTDRMPSAPSRLSGSVIEVGEHVPAAGEAARDTFGDADLIARLERVDALLSGGALCAYAEPAETFARVPSGACSDDLEFYIEEQGRLGDSEEEEHGGSAREGGE